MPNAGAPTGAAPQVSLGVPAIPYEEFKKFVLLEAEAERAKCEVAELKAAGAAKDKEIADLRKQLSAKGEALEAAIKKIPDDTLAKFRKKQLVTFRDELKSSITEEYPKQGSYNKIDDAAKHTIANILAEALINSATISEASLIVESRVAKRVSGFRNTRCELDFNYTGQPSSGKYLKFVVGGFPIQIFGEDR